MKRNLLIRSGAGGHKVKKSQGASQFQYKEAEMSDVLPDEEDALIAGIDKSRVSVAQRFLSFLRERRLGIKDLVTLAHAERVALKEEFEILEERM